MNNKDNPVHNEFVANIRRVFERTLPSSFVQVDPWHWVRERNWRKDDLYAVVRNETFAVNAQVIIPPIPGSRFAYMTLAVENLPALSGNPDTIYRFAAGEDALRQLELEVPLALAWFDDFNSPRRCLDYLENDRTRNRDSVAYKYCHDYLVALL